MNPCQAELFSEQPDATPDLLSYDHVLVAFSGGKDSLAALLSLIARGVPLDRIELHHHDIDGAGKAFMDWTCTPAYCRAVAQALGVPIYFSYREGGFLREMLKDGDRTAPVVFERPDGTMGRAGGERGKIGTRRRFPQVSPDLRVRWCSSVLKIDVLSAAICNQRRFHGKRLLVVTGERAEESSNRARYRTFEPHRTNAQRRHVDHYRPVHAWKEAEVWDFIRRAGIMPHPAYYLGWGRLSCMTCIFGNADQWATIRAIFPARFEAVARWEEEFGTTIHRTESVRQLANRGKPYPSALLGATLIAQAESAEWITPIITANDNWAMPAGAGAENAGPT